MLEGSGEVHGALLLSPQTPGTYETKEGMRLIQGGCAKHQVSSTPREWIREGFLKEAAVTLRPWRVGR